MKNYPAGQVLTVSELRIGDALHCGQTAGQCMVWHVVDKDERYAYIKVGGSLVKMTGHDLRSGLAMFRATECPNCANPQAQSPSRPKTPEAKLVAVELEAAYVKSALSNVQNRRFRNDINSGAASLITPAADMERKAKALLEKIMPRKD